MSRYKIGKFISKKDIAFNIADFPNKWNIIFVTGLFGSGKSTLGNNLAQKLGAVHLQQDWLTWSECYANEESKFFVQEFQKLYPETKVYFEKRLWHGNEYVSKEAKKHYRKAFDQMLIDYALAHKDKLFVMEGASLFKHEYTANLIKQYPVIIKRTSLVRSLRNMCKRDLGKVSIKGMKSLWKKNYRHWTRDRKILNDYIMNLVERCGKKQIAFLELN